MPLPSPITDGRCPDTEGVTPGGAVPLGVERAALLPLWEPHSSFWLSRGPPLAQAWWKQLCGTNQDTVPIPLSSGTTLWGGGDTGLALAAWTVLPGRSCLAQAVAAILVSPGCFSSQMGLHIDFSSKFSFFIQVIYFTIIYVYTKCLASFFNCF